MKEPKEKSGHVSVLPLLITLFLLSSSCGSSSSTDSSALPGVGGAFSENTIPVNLLTGEVAADNSIVKVVVKFKDGTDVSLDAVTGEGAGLFKSADFSVSSINAVITADTSRVISVRRAVNSTEEEVDKWREEWARRGVELHDWNLYYRFDLPDEESANQLIKELRGDASVEYVEMLPEYYLTEVTTPDISDEQGYLRSAAEGGLGIEDAWAKLDARFPGKNVRGQNSGVVDHEFDWNFEHEMLTIDETEEYVSPDNFIGEWFTYGSTQGRNVPSNINHGTAVLGIVAGQGGLIDRAIKGIAPHTTPRVATMASNGMLGFGGGYAEGETDRIGTVYLIEVQQKGITTVSSGCGVGDGIASPSITGCVPIESHKYLHAEIRDSASAGRIVIAGAGNGSVNLDNDDLAAPIGGMGAYSYFTYPENDSGSIIVGASLGADKRKAPWSNCGDRVDLFAWGAGVVTAGYGDRFNPDGANPNVLGPMGADNPRLYTGQFGGTSAATAQIAGIAVLVQSYMRQVVEDAGFVGKTVYLDSKEMRDILKKSGTAAVYNQTPGDPNPNCNIGVQPNAALAIQLTEEYLSDPETVLKIVPTNQYVVSGIRYDMDDDKKAELISFSRDHKWYIDLSNDGFGEWNVILDVSNSLILSPSKDAMLFPVVADYNSDGRADLALYDSINGLWYIKYMNTLTLSLSKGEAISWDKIIDYSTDPNWKAYSRPLPIDYNVDKWLDIVLQTPDGYWLVDDGGFDGIRLVNEQVEYIDRFGVFEKNIKYLSDDQLAETPGWTYLPAPGEGGGNAQLPYFKAPDGVLNNANYIYYSAFVDGSLVAVTRNKEVFLAGDNDSYFIVAGYSNNSSGSSVGFKRFNGEWIYNSGSFKFGSYTPPQSGYGDVLCRPIPADYDGDGKDDMAAQCGTNWKIVRSSDSQTMIFELGEAIDPIPAYVYPGGIKYQDQLALFNYYKTELQCGASTCNASSTIYDVNPPIGPYFAECVNYWAPDAAYCWDK